MLDQYDGDGNLAIVGASVMFKTYLIREESDSLESVVPKWVALYLYVLEVNNTRI